MRFPFSRFSMLLAGALLFCCPATFAGPMYQVRTVVIDAGHGGHDHGCSGLHSREKEVALKIALKVGAYIEQYLPDVQVIYTRKTDVFVELHERAAIANRANADVFISIHCNSNQNKAPYGTETYVMGLHRNEANLGVAKRENEVILLEDDYNHHYDGFDPASPNAHIIFSLFQSAHLEQSIELAGRIEEQFSERVGRKSRGVKQAGFLVLYKTTMPAVLVETGFLSNAGEEDFLASENGIDLMASAVFRAFRDYKVHTENRASLPQTVDETAEERPVPPGPAKETPQETAKVQAKEAATEPAKEPAKQSEKASPSPAVAAEKKPLAQPAEAPKKPVEQSKPAAQLVASSQQPLSAPETAPVAPTTLPAVVYRVQIYASQRKLVPTDPLFKALNGRKVYRTQHGNLYKYAVGQFNTAEEAAELKTNLRNSGYPDAFVISVDSANLAEN